jgi:hypothetical protein
MSLEAQWGRNPREETASARFLGLIERSYEKTGQRVVVLVDEYDKPLLETMYNPELNEEVRKTLKGFYGVLKKADSCLRFVLLTGITRFSQVSVFSDLNHLKDISMRSEYAELCGISGTELIRDFQPELHILAEKNGISFDKALEEMRRYYNGYHFCEKTEGIFNPFSVLNTLESGKFSYYWFQTGTPTFLINALKSAGFYLPNLAEEVTIQEQFITDYRADGTNPIPILYQSGYLTIKNYDGEFKTYTLGFPNEEVQYGFLNELLLYYGTNNGQEFDMRHFVKDLRNGDIDAFMTRLKAFFAGIPYELSDNTERHYQTLFFLVFTLMGQFTQAEVRSAKGRADMVVSTNDRIYIFEFKLSGSGTAEEALKQIDDKGYLIPYTAGGRRITKIGVEFDIKERNIGRWSALDK